MNSTTHTHIKYKWKTKRYLLCRKLQSNSCWGFCEKEQYIFIFVMFQTRPLFHMPIVNDAAWVFSNIFPYNTISPYLTTSSFCALWYFFNNSSLSLSLSLSLYFCAYKTELFLQYHYLKRANIENKSNFRQCIINHSYRSCTMVLHTKPYISL